MANLSAIKIQEIIPLTIQGEGYNTGLPVSFIRLFGCPVGCPWCDTGYGDIKSATYSVMSIDEILPQLQSNNIVISGGEPLVNPAMPALLIHLLGLGKKLFIETSGIREIALPPEMVDQIWVTFSPKEHISDTGNINHQIIDQANELKIVIKEESDFEYYQDLIETFKRQKKPIYLQPEHKSLKSSLPLSITLANNNSVNTSNQIHKFLGVR